MKKILHFEDDKFLSQIFNKIFKKYGFDCVSYESPTKDPVSLVLKEKPDLIVMDVLMPVLDGFAATELLKSNDQTKKIPIVGLCNLGQPDDIKKALDLGMTKYLVTAHHKPYEVVQELYEVLHAPCPAYIEPPDPKLQPLLVPRPWFWKLVSWFKKIS